MALTWENVLGSEKKQPYFINMMNEIASRRSQGVIIYPPKEQVFNALAFTALNDIRVVILGQDPYHGPNQAHGLCFSVLGRVRTPPSLVNIYKELRLDIPGFSVPVHGDLTAWAKQGVLLLNTVLTVEAGKAHSHAKLGWETFTDRVMDVINEHTQDTVFLLWGSHAQRKAAKVDMDRHFVLKAPHPSPLSAHRGFFGCKHFSKTNAFLVSRGHAPIEWQL